MLVDVVCLSGCDGLVGVKSVDLWCGGCGHWYFLCLVVCGWCVVGEFVRRRPSSIDGGFPEVIFTLTSEMCWFGSSGTTRSPVQTAVANTGGCCICVGYPGKKWRWCGGCVVVV